MFRFKQQGKIIWYNFLLLTKKSQKSCAVNAMGQLQATVRYLQQMNHAYVELNIKIYLPNTIDDLSDTFDFKRFTSSKLFASLSETKQESQNCNT